MKDTIKTVILVSLLLGIPLGFCVHFSNEIKKEEARKRQEQERAVAEALHRGILMGVNATVKHMKFDFQTGKATLELTNIFAELETQYNLR